MSTYEISKSSLLSLKAEILRKQQELSKTKSENNEKLRNIKKTPLIIKNKGIEQRMENDINDVDEDVLTKSRKALEAKSLLYEKLSKEGNNVSEEDYEYNRRYLVRFDKKAASKTGKPSNDSDNEEDYDRYPKSEDDNDVSEEYEPATNVDDEWVEYVDCLGRTRTCLRKDLEFLKGKDDELKKTVDLKKIVVSPEPDNIVKKEQIDTEENIPSDKTELLSSDMRRELLRQQWEKEEEQLQNKSNIHYQDVLFQEARTHGVGYYGFSKDEEERAKQQEELRKLREETEQQQKKSQDLKAIREKQLAARLKAARNRKRARMGLPPEEDEPEPEKPKEEEKVPELTKPDTSEQELEREKARNKHIRPWDVGKDGVRSEHYEYTQEEWVDKKRKERPTEFAPPTNYRKDFRSAEVNFDEKYEHYENKNSLSFSSKKISSTKTENNNFDLNKRKQSINPYKNDDFEYIKPSKRIEPVSIVNEVECSSEEEEEDRLLGDFRNSINTNTNKFGEESNSCRGIGVEIAPPPTFEYYGPSYTSKKLRPETEKVPLQDSIDAGLKYLRTQYEKKESSKKHPDEIFLF